MSFGFGVGDIVLLLKSIKTGYDKYKNAPDAVKDAVQDVEYIHVGITYIQKHYPVDEKEFIKMFDETAYESPFLLSSLSSQNYLNKE